MSRKTSDRPTRDQAKESLYNMTKEFGTIAMMMIDASQVKSSYKAKTLSLYFAVHSLEIYLKRNIDRQIALGDTIPEWDDLIKMTDEVATMIDAERTDADQVNDRS